MTTPARPRRFYRDVAVAATGEGHEVRLDGRPVKTVRGVVLRAASAPLAEAIAAEWAGQGDEIDRAAMPMTALASTALDADETTLAQWRGDVLSYLHTDLLCYRAETPAALRERQAAAWDPWLAWFEKTFGAAMSVTQGVTAAAQPEGVARAGDRALAPLDAPGLFGVRQATALAGSAVLGLALARGAGAAAALFDASIVDETFQAEQWGWDGEAAARVDAMRTEFLRLGDFLALVRGAGNASGPAGEK